MPLGSGLKAAVLGFLTSCFELDKLKKHYHPSAPTNYESHLALVMICLPLEVVTIIYDYLFLFDYTYCDPGSVSLWFHPPVPTPSPVANLLVLWNGQLAHQWLEEAKMRAPKIRVLTLRTKADIEHVDWKRLENRDLVVIPHYSLVRLQEANPTFVWRHVIWAGPRNCTPLLQFNSFFIWIVCGGIFISGVTAQEVDLIPTIFIHSQ